MNAASSRFGVSFPGSGWRPAATAPAGRRCRRCRSRGPRRCRRAEAGLERRSGRGRSRPWPSASKPGAVAHLHVVGVVGRATSATASTYCQPCGAARRRSAGRPRGSRRCRPRGSSALLEVARVDDLSVAGRDLQVVDEPARLGEAGVGRVGEAEQRRRLAGAGRRCRRSRRRNGVGIAVVAGTRSTVCVPAAYEPLEPVRPLPYCAWQPFWFGFAWRRSCSRSPTAKDCVGLAAVGRRPGRSRSRSPTRCPRAT